MMKERLFTILVFDKKQNFLEFAASVDAVDAVHAAKYLLDMFREFDTHTEDEIKKAKFHHDEIGGMVHIGTREYYLVTEEFVAKAPLEAQRVFTNIMKKSAKNQIPC